jgi:hypothetical protein
VDFHEPRNQLTDGDLAGRGGLVLQGVARAEVCPSTMLHRFWRRRSAVSSSWKSMAHPLVRPLGSRSRDTPTGRPRQIARWRPAKRPFRSATAAGCAVDGVTLPAGIVCAVLQPDSRTVAGASHSRLDVAATASKFPGGASVARRSSRSLSASTLQPVFSRSSSRSCLYGGARIPDHARVRPRHTTARHRAVPRRLPRNEKHAVTLD